MKRYTYHNPEPITKAEAELIFSSGNVEKLCDAMVSVAYYEPDWIWAQDKFLEFLKNDNPIISGLAATCLSHIARIHLKLDKKRVLNELKAHLTNTHISGSIEDALGDIEIFIKE